MRPGTSLILAGVGPPLIGHHEAITKALFS